ncbi:hypothetical protein TcBrA4_0128330 [Trypanosoma cruzi]|nr:hypothetical protein TcBrA4_0128330 [Trypanosoma cruzi]
MGGEQCGPRDPGAAEVGAENDAGGATHNLLLHARKADERGGPCGLFDGGGGDGTLVGPARLPVGYKTSPQIPQIIITSAIAGLTAVTHASGLHLIGPYRRLDRQCTHSRVDKRRDIVGDPSASYADGRRATIGEERESGATHYNFLGVQFDHTPGGIPE